jgi:exopolysaccharide/PEP-CTERM locus tyrosine autokinase
MSAASERNAPRSLIERASAVYDFDAAARARRPMADAPAPRPRVIEEAPAAVVARPAPPPSANRVGTVDREKLAAAGFIVPDDGASAIMEEFRIVKRQLLHAATAPDAPANARMILIASALPEEGKTFCAVNLALSMAAEKDHEVLLVDADVANPSVLSTLGLEAGPGLIDAIASRDEDVEACIIRTDVPNLYVLPAGTPRNDATELLASSRTRAVLERLCLQRSRRIVIFDSPPALAASPASELAHHVGQVVLVVRADRTSDATLREAAGLLAGCANIRLLLNGSVIASGGRRFGSYYGQGG